MNESVRWAELISADKARMKEGAYLNCIFIFHYTMYVTGIGSTYISSAEEQGLNRQWQVSSKVVVYLLSLGNWVTYFTTNT